MSGYEEAYRDTLFFPLRSSCSYPRRGLQGLPYSLPLGRHIDHIVPDHIVPLFLLAPLGFSFSFLADLPGDALGAKLAVSFGIGARATFLTVSLDKFLTNRKSFPLWMTNAIHGIDLLVSALNGSNSFSNRRIFSSNSSKIKS